MITSLQEKLQRLELACLLPKQVGYCRHVPLCDGMLSGEISKAIDPSYPASICSPPLESRR
jgi:hypothetical protein